MEKEKRERENRLQFYRPYKKQRDFHAAGAWAYERLFMAGNQLGKTLSGAAEMAMHLTGEYPDWWEGKRWDRPIRAIAGSESGELTRDGVQRLLIGEPEDEGKWGEGYVPKRRLKDWSKRQGIANALDSVIVSHKNGGTSSLLFKSYEQGRGKWQANTVDYVWFDEEPDEEIYSEGKTRTIAVNGIVALTFTPLKGMSRVVRRFLAEPETEEDKVTAKYRSVTRMTIHDVEHYAPEARARVIAGFPEHERDARSEGIPMLGSGSIYPVSTKSIVVDPFTIPHYWPRIGGIDFGWDHPTACVQLAWNRDNDTIYVLQEHKMAKAVPVVHAATVRQWGADMPWAWPHDGAQTDKGSGEQLAHVYKKAGLKMLGERASFEEGGNSVEAGILKILQRMIAGQLKVFSTCTSVLDEIKLYHRKDGKIVKENDDLLDALRYATMMIRHARVPGWSRGSKDSVGRVALGTGEVNF